MMSWKSGWWVLALVAAVAARGQTTYNGIATACTYQVSTPIAGSLAASGVDGSFTITTGPGCPWTAAANYSISPPSPWVTFNPASGNGTTTVNYSILSNTGASRTATLVIAGQTFPLTESGGATAPAGGGAGTWQPAGTGDCAGGDAGATTDSPPGTGKCTASFAGSKTITATDAANVTVSGTSAAIVVPAAATGSGPFISGTPTPNVSLDLTTTGMLDWVHWGNSLTSGDMGITRKSSGGNMIGTLTHVLAPVGQNQPTYAMYQGDSRSLTWTDGKPTQTAPGDVSGFKAYDVYGPDSRWGYSLTFPAGTGANTVVLYLGGVSCGGTLTAALGDKSATFAGYTFPAQSAAWDLNYTLSFQAASATTLTVTWTMAGNNTGGNGNLFISAAALSSGGSIAPPPATHFSVTAPASANQGVPINFTVTALDSSNNTVTGYTGPVKFSSTDNAATLPPNMSLANGVGTFPATMETLGGQTLTATDASNSSLTGMTSAAIVVNATRLVFTAAPPAATVGTAFNFTVTAEDANNNTLAGFADTVKFTSTDNAATLPANHTLSNGVGAFQATLNTAGGKTITATDAANGTVSGTSAAILVSAAGSGPFLSGTPTPNVSLDLTTTGMLDWVHWGNSLAIGDMGITRKSGGNMIGTLTQVLPPAGQIQPTFTLYNYDSRSLTWTDGNPTQTAAGDGSGFKVYDVYGPPNNYGWSLTFPAGTGANTVVLYLGGMSCGGTLTATLGDPSATFPGYTFPAQSAPWDLNYTLSFEAASATTLTVTWTMAGNMGGGGNLYISAAALSSGGSNGPGPATHFAVTPAVTTATAGTAINFTVTAQDANNNTVTGYTGTVHFTSTDGAATLPSNNSTLTGGTGSFNVIFNTPGGQTITATDTVTSTITGTSTSIAVTGTVGGTNPFVQQGGKLVGSNPIQSANEILQGASVAISADGSTAAVGAPEDNGGGLTQGIGAVYVYSRANGVWTQQGGKLIGTGASSQAGVGQAQGSGVALSADGNTLVETGLFDIGLHNGSAWVFTRSNGAWTQLGSKFQASGNMGAGAALSADGNTLMLAGTVGTQTPTAFIFSRSGSTWTQQASLVVSSAIGAFVTTDSIALSGDGNTALIGATSENNYVGAAWVFTRSGGAWTQQAKLTGSGAAGGIGPDQGKSVALSADGNTALVGGFLDNNAAGAVWVYTRSGTTWTQQGSKLIGTGAANGNGSGADQGVSVSLSADGNTAIWGGDNDNNTAGAVWVFTRSNGTWTQLGSKLVGTGGASSANQGIAVAISGDGNTLIEGGPYDGGYGSSNTGAAWVFARSAQSGGTGPATHFAVTPAATTATAGQAIGFTVTAQDANNNTVTSYTGPAGPVTFTSSDTNAAWQAGNTANLTNGAGTFLVTLNTLGTQTITATGTGITGTSAGIAVTAAPASCTYTIAGPVANSPTAAGVDGSFNVITGAGCPWTATASYIVTPSSPWIVFAPAAGSAVSYSILANTGTARSATISVGGHSFPVTQGGGATAPAGGGTGTWTPAGTGDCSGSDVAATTGSVPDTAQCTASFAGFTAECYSSGCTYKNVSTAACKGGSFPAQQYTCVPSGGTSSAPTVTYLNLQALSDSGVNDDEGVAWNTYTAGYALGVTAPTLGSGFLNAADRSVQLSAGTYYLYGTVAQTGAGVIGYSQTVGPYLKVSANWSDGHQESYVFSPPASGNGAWTQLSAYNTGTLENSLKNLTLCGTGITNANRVSQEALQPGPLPNWVLDIGILTQCTSGPTTTSPGGTSPAAGNGYGQTMTYTFGDPLGYQNITVVDILINNALDGVGACYIAYSQPLNVLYLVQDAGPGGANGGLLLGITLGATGSVSNSQCTVSAAGSSAGGTGNTLNLTLIITFNSNFGGNMVTYLAAGNLQGANSGWHALGTWAVPATTTGTIQVVSLTPPRGAAPAGTPQTFMTTLTDSVGAGDFGVVNVLVNNFVDGRQACYLAYVASSNSLFLVDDGGDAGGPYAGGIVLNGSSTAIQNSQCSISAAGSSAVANGNALTLTLNITFLPAFKGDHVVWVAGRDRASGNNTNWQAMGTYTVQ